MSGSEVEVTEFQIETEILSDEEQEMGIKEGISTSSQSRTQLPTESTDVYKTGPQPAQKPQRLSLDSKISTDQSTSSSTISNGKVTGKAATTTLITHFKKEPSVDIDVSSESTTASDQTERDLRKRHAPAEQENIPRKQSKSDVLAKPCVENQSTSSHSGRTEIVMDSLDLNQSQLEYPIVFIEFNRKVHCSIDL